LPGRGGGDVGVVRRVWRPGRGGAAPQSAHRRLPSPTLPHGLIFHFFRFLFGSRRHIPSPALLRGALTFPSSACLERDSANKPYLTIPCPITFTTTTTIAVTIAICEMSSGSLPPPVTPRPHPIPHTNTAFPVVLLGTLQPCYKTIICALMAILMAMLISSVCFSLLCLHVSCPSQRAASNCHSDPAHPVPFLVRCHVYFFFNSDAMLSSPMCPSSPASSTFVFLDC